MRILVVEDEPDLAEALVGLLREEGYACDHAVDGECALFDLEAGCYDAVVLDLMLPRVDGRRVLARMRGAGDRTPVLVLTARDGLPDKVNALDSGADDYLTKPFALEELLARLRSLIRRSAGTPAPGIDLGPVQLDTVARLVLRDGASVALAPKEYAVLELLALRRGRLVTRTEIYDHLYDASDPTCSNVLDVYVAQLRRKLGHELIQTRRGEGYWIP